MNKFTDFCEEHDLLVMITSTILGGFFLIWFIGYGIYKYGVEVGAANIVRVYIQTGIMEETLIYEGKQAFISIESGGATTTVVIYKKLFPFMVIEKTYSNKTIRID